MLVSVLFLEFEVLLDLGFHSANQSYSLGSQTVLCTACVALSGLELDLTFDSVVKYQLCSVLTWEKAKLRPVKKSSVLLGDCSPVPVQIYIF